jgi:hypothetical protein
MQTNPLTPPMAPGPPRPRGKVFDVMAPGKAPAHPTSRPVVIGHRQQAQETQVSVSGIGGPGPRDNLLDVHQKVELQPAGHVDATDETSKDLVPHQAEHPTSPASEPDSQPAASQEDALAVVAMEPESPAPAPLPPEPASPVSEQPGNDSVPDIVSPTVELDRQVVVSHHTTAPSSTWKFVGLIALAVFFALVVLDILLDAGVISSSAIPHTHFF